MEKTAFSIYLAVLIISVLFFGAVHTHFYTLMYLCIFIASILVVISSINKDPFSEEYQLVFHKNPINFLFLGFLILLFLQLIPLPNILLQYLSPVTLVVKQKSLSVTSENITNEFFISKWLSISPYAHPVKMSIVRWTSYGLFFLGIVKLLNSRKRIELMVIIILILGFFESFYGIIQTYSGDAYIWWYKIANDYVNGTYINRNHFAFFMTMCLLLSGCYFISIFDNIKKKVIWKRNNFRSVLISYFDFEDQINTRTFILFLGVIIGLGLILSASRGGILSSLVGILSIVFIVISRKHSRNKWYMVLILFFLILIYALNVGVDYTIQRFELESLNDSFKVRHRYVVKAVETFKDYNLTGVGIGNFKNIYPKYQAKEDRNSYIDYAHNDWIQLLSESGITGFCILFFGMFLYLYKVGKVWLERRDPFAIGLGIVSFSVLLAVAIHSYSDFSLHIPANFLTLISILAISYSAIHLKSHGKERLTYYVLPLKYKGAFAIIFITGFILWNLIFSINHFIAEANCSTEIDSTLNREQNPSEDDIKKAIQWQESKADYWYKLANALINKRDKITDRESINDEIIKSLENAVILNPLNAEYHIRLGWEYTYLWQKPDYYKKWLSAADNSMERASYFAGVSNTNNHMELGNYWTMRSKTLNPTIPEWDIYWNRAVWHYKKLLEIEDEESLRKDFSEKIKKYVWIFYPDDFFINQIVNHPQFIKQ